MKKVLSALVPILIVVAILGLFLFLFFRINYEIFTWQLYCPDDDPNILWVSEDPQMYFAWTGKGHTGELTVDGRTISVNVGYRFRVMSVFIFDEDNCNHTLFGGGMSCRRDRVMLTVSHDNENVFGGKLPTIIFSRVEKE